MRTYFLLSLIVILDFILLVFKINDLSISYREILLLESATPFSYLINFILDVFGKNDLILRCPMLLFHLFSTLLLFIISKSYLKHITDSLWLVFIFIMIPAVASSAILVDPAGMVIFLLLLYVYVYQKFKYVHYMFLLLYVWIDISFSLLYLGLFFYSIYNKERIQLVVSMLLFALSMFMFSFDTTGTPTGHFLDIFGIYLFIFSPVIFLYIFYVLYHRLIIKELDLLWFLSASALSLSLLLSFRQNIPLEIFAPYLVLAFPLTAQTFFTTYRIRLRRFRRRYRFLFTLSLSLLIFNFIIVFFNQYLYLVLDNPRNNFAYKSHLAKELSYTLLSKNIQCVNLNDSGLQKRVEFYGVTKCNNIELVNNRGKNLEKVTIGYKGKIIYSRSVEYSNI